ncbi:MAG: thioesterase family protein [Planctomycetota bacterium]
MREHQTEIRVRYDECDPMGFVHHSVYLRYFEIGRTELLRACGGRYREMESEGMFVVVARADVRYKSPARYDDLLVVTTKIAKISEVKIIHDYEVTRDTELVATANLTMVMLDKNGTVQRIPSALIALFQD